MLIIRLVLVIVLLSVSFAAQAYCISDDNVNACKEIDGEITLSKNGKKINFEITQGMDIAQITKSESNVYMILAFQEPLNSNHDYMLVVFDRDLSHVISTNSILKPKIQGDAIIVYSKFWTYHNYGMPQLPHLLYFGVKTIPYYLLSEEKNKIESLLKKQVKNCSENSILCWPSESVQGVNYILKSIADM